MEEKNQSLALKNEDPLQTAQENVVFQEGAEERFAHVINTIDNYEVAKGLRYCDLLSNTAWESLRQVLTTYRMSCLIVKITLCIDKTDFEKLCGYIGNQEQVKQLSELYNAYQVLPVSYEKFEKSSSENQHGYSLINLQFIHLTQKIHAIIKNPALLLNDFQRLMASKIYSTPLFRPDYLKGFNAMIDKPALFQALGIFWTWSDHSILKELLHMGKHKEAINLLDKFDRYLESFKSMSIEKFPLPILSSRMIPVDIKKHAYTILAIKYKISYHKCTWQNISKACNSLKDIFEITRNAMQLLGVLNNNSEYTLIYLMIPTSVISLITSKITRFDYYSGLCENNITEVAIYPKALFSADASVKVGPLSFFMNVPVIPPKPSKHSEKEPYCLVSSLSKTEELPEIVQILLKKLNDSKAELMHAVYNKEKLSIENEKKDANITTASKKNADLQDTISRLEQEIKRLQDNENDYNKKIAANYEQLQIDLLQSKELLKKYEENIETLQQEKNAVNYEQLQTDLLQSSELLKEYEGKIQILQQDKEKAELELKTSMESLKDELSNLQSQIMMKTTQNQKLSENNVSLTKHLNKLKEKEKMERIRAEEKSQILIMESDQLKSKISNLLTEIMKLTESNQALNKEVQILKDERDNEIKLLNEQADQIRSHNSNLIAESDTLNSEKLSLQQQLEESHKQIQSYQQQVEQLKADKLRLSKSNRSLKQQLTECEKDKNKFSKAAHLSSKSAKHANTAVALFCKPSTPQQRFGRSRSFSFSESSYDGSSSLTSLSTTTGTTSTREPTDETRFPNQAEDDLEFEDNEN